MTVTGQKDDVCACRIIHEARIAKARQGGLPPGEVEEAARLFKALADPTRLRMLWALEEGEMCVCDLAALLGITESAVSHHLRLLRTMRLVSNRRAGPVLYYRLTDRHVSRLTRLALEHIRE